MDARFPQVRVEPGPAIDQSKKGKKDTQVRGDQLAIMKKKKNRRRLMGSQLGCQPLAQGVLEAKHHLSLESHRKA